MKALVFTFRLCPYCGRLTRVMVDTAMDVNYYTTLCVWYFGRIRVEAVKTQETNQFGATIHQLMLYKS